MKDKIFIIPEANSYVTTVNPTIYGSKELSVDDIVGKDSIYKYSNIDVFIKDVLRDNNRVFAIIDGQYYRLDTHNYNLTNDEIKASCSVSFTEDQIKEIANGTFRNYIPENKEEPPIVEIPPTTDGDDNDSSTEEGSGTTKPEETPEVTPGGDTENPDQSEGSQPETGTENTVNEAQVRSVSSELRSVNPELEKTEKQNNNKPRRK